MGELARHEAEHRAMRQVGRVNPRPAWSHWMDVGGNEWTRYKAEVRAGRSQAIDRDRGYVTEYRVRYLGKGFGPRYRVEYRIVKAWEKSMKTRRNSVRLPARPSARNPSDFVTASHLADDLVLTIENEGAMYEKVKRVQRKIAGLVKRGTYSEEKGVRAVVSLIAEGMRYYKRAVPGTRFSRLATGLAQGRLAALYASESAAGEYDWLLKNPAKRRHEPKLPGRGRPSNNAWWRATTVAATGRKGRTHIAQGSRDEAVAGAKKLAKGSAKVILDGPFSRKPAALKKV